jgi:hypothetical protein
MAVRGPDRSAVRLADHADDGVLQRASEPLEILQAGPSSLSSSPSSSAANWPTTSCTLCSEPMFPV